MKRRLWMWAVNWPDRRSHLVDYYGDPFLSACGIDSDFPFQWQLAPGEKCDFCHRFEEALHLVRAADPLT